MAIVHVQSARNFRHIRGAAFGVMVFLRVAWGFIIALNTFSKTTKMEMAHLAISSYLFAINILAVLFSVVIATVETWRRQWAWWSQVSFEIGWLIMFIVLELIGAIIFTILEPTFKCSFGFVNVFRVPDDNTAELRKRDEAELVEQTCNLYNLLTVVFVWVIVALSLFYTLFFILLAKVASWRDPDVWHSQVNKFDWSVTATDHVDPRTLERPGNPQMEKASEKSSIIPGFEPAFINPFSSDQDVLFTPQLVANPSRPRGQAMDRHQVMAQYAGEPETPVNQARYSQSVKGLRPLILSAERSTFGDFDARQLAAMRLEGSTPEQMRARERNKPSLSVRIPPPSESRDRTRLATPVSPKTQRQRPRESAGTTLGQNEVLFQGSFSPESQAATPHSAGAALGTPYSFNPSSVPNIPPLHMSFLNGGFSPIYQSPMEQLDDPALQSDLAPHRYPEIVRSPNRKSARVVPDHSPHSSTREEARYSRSATPSGAVLPMHSGDLSTGFKIPRIPPPRLPASQPYVPITPEARQNQIYRAQTERRNGLRPASGPAHSRSASDQAWPPHPRQSRHIPTGSAPPVLSSAVATGPKGPWSPPGLSGRPYSHRPKSAYEARVPSGSWGSPGTSASSSSGVPPVPALPPSARHIRHPSMPPPAASKSGRTLAGPEDSPFGTPPRSEPISSYESNQATWQELDEKYRTKCEKEENRRSRGKLRKPDPRIFRDEL